MQDLKVMVCGACGAMGRTLISLIEETDGFTAVCGFDPFSKDKTEEFPIYSDIKDITENIDVVIDFSHFSLTDEITKWCVDNRKPLVSAVTGVSKESEELLKSASSEIAVFRSANFSYGVNVMKKIVALATKLLYADFDIEVLEAHHNKKADAPSGTAKMLLDEIQANSETEYETVYGRNGQCKRKHNDIGVHAIRGGAIAGEHEVMYISEDEIITLHHSAMSKRVFASGALKAARYVANKERGFYSMEDMLNI